MLNGLLLACFSAVVQQQDGSSGSGARGADDLPLPDVPKQRRRRRKQEQQPKEFTIDDLNPISSAWVGGCAAARGWRCALPNVCR